MLKFYIMLDSIFFSYVLILNYIVCFSFLFLLTSLLFILKLYAEAVNLFFYVSTIS